MFFCVIIILFAETPYCGKEKKASRIAATCHFPMCA